MVLSWANGNGGARIIIAREGSPTNFVPSDNSTYIGNPAFGRSSKYGPNLDNFVVYNSNVTNFVKIDSLKPGKTYYFTIFEHDNAGSSTLYYTTGAPGISLTTYDTKLDFDIKYYDSCQAHNLYEFTNKSTSTVPGIGYFFDFYDGDSSSSSPVMHSYKISGLIPAKIRVRNNLAGCPGVFTRAVRVYQKKVVYFDWVLSNKDTVQCYYNNLFKIRTGNYTNPLSGSYSYMWFSNKDSFLGYFSFLQTNLKTAGRHKISLEITINISKGQNTYPTGCKDTLSFSVYIHPDHLLNAKVNHIKQEIDTNKFRFGYDSTNSLVSPKWFFGDGDSSDQSIVSHTYSDTGWYIATLRGGKDSMGCYHEKKFLVRVFLDTTKNDTTGIHYKRYSSQLTIYPNPANDRVNIKSQSGQILSSIHVYDMIGNKVREIKVTESSYELDMTDLPSGTYLLKVQYGDAFKAALIRVQR